MKRRIFIGIDTSNYTTSVAACTENGEVIVNLKKLLSVEHGERGLRQSDALFLHSKNLPEMMTLLRDRLRECANDTEIAAVGYSAYPRDVEGSYMPCFLAGQAAAYSFAAALDAPIYKFSHQAGHVVAALYSSGGETEILSRAQECGGFAAFHVSGGTTEVLLCSPSDRSISIKQIGGTKDINAGQAIDRAGVMMGLDFPCGREMEAICGDTQNAQPVRVCTQGLYCNLSGLENKASKLYLQTGDRAAVSAYVFDFVGATLKNMSLALRTEYSDIPILYAGGVMSNKRIKNTLSELDGTYFATPEFSADNAAGVSLLCRAAYLRDTANT